MLLCYRYIADTAIQSAPKRAKVAVREEAASKKDMALGEIGMKNKTIKNERGVKKVRLGCICWYIGLYFS